MNLMELFKKAGEMQAKAREMETQLAAIEVEGSSGAGLVRVALNGKSELKRVAVDASLLKPEDRAIVEDLLIAAHADAKAKIDERVAGEMQKMAGALGLPPGFGFPG